MARFSDTECCSINHKNKLAAWRATGQTVMQNKRDNWLRSRARRMAARLGVRCEPYTSTEIFERDNWTCWLCKRPVDRTAPRYDRFGPSLDHVFPLSKGGADAPFNVRCAHYGCNARKNDRVMPEHFCFRPPRPRNRAEREAYKARLNLLHEQQAQAPEKS